MKLSRGITPTNRSFWPWSGLSLEQFHEYLTPYGKNTNEFVVRTDNNPLTYIFSSTHLNACGLWWVASLAGLQLLPGSTREKKIIQSQTSSVGLRIIWQMKNWKSIHCQDTSTGCRGSVLNNAGTSITERAESGEDLQPIRACLAETLATYPAQLTTLHVTDWKQAQCDDPADQCSC